jgi:Holliday junction resolvase
MGLSGAAAHAKGQRGERELFALLSDLLGFVVRRKASNRKGEPDGIDIPGWAVEVKRTEQPKLTEW